MSREAFEAWAAGNLPGGPRLNELAHEAWQAALAYAYEDAARVCDGMHPEVWPSAYADAIRKRAKEVTR